MAPAQRIRFWLVGLVVFAALVYLLRAMLLPFVAGMAAAYFLDPLADRLERAGLNRTLATSTITAAFFGVVVLLAVLLLPLLEEQVLAFAHRVPGYIDALGERLDPYLREFKRRLSPGDIEKLRSSAGAYAGTAVGWLLDFVRSLLSGGMAVINLLSLLFITPIVTFYLLRDWDQMTATVDSWLPLDHADTIRQQLRLIDRTLSGFVRGQAMVCLIMAAFLGIGLTVVGLELGLVIGMVSGLISFIPYLGAIAGITIGIGVAFAQTQDWMLPALVAGIFAAGSLIEGNVLVPKLVGDKVGLHPVWIMFALLAGGALVGFVGVLLAVPVAAIIGVLARFFLARYLASPLHRGHP